MNSDNPDYTPTMNIGGQFTRTNGEVAMHSQVMLSVIGNAVNGAMVHHFSIASLDYTEKEVWDKISDVVNLYNIRVILMPRSISDQIDDDALEVVESLYNKGVLLISNAGNNGSENNGDSEKYPQHYKYFESIASVDPFGAHSFFSSTGTNPNDDELDGRVKFAMPGEYIPVMLTFTKEQLKKMILTDSVMNSINAWIRSNIRNLVQGVSGIISYLIEQIRDRILPAFSPFTDAILNFLSDLIGDAQDTLIDSLVQGATLTLNILVEFIAQMAYKILITFLFDLGIISAPSAIYAIFSQTISLKVPTPSLNEDAYNFFKDQGVFIAGTSISSGYFSAAALVAHDRYVEGRSSQGESGQNSQPGASELLHILMASASNSVSTTELGYGWVSFERVYNNGYTAGVNDIPLPPIAIYGLRNYYFQNTAYSRINIQFSGSFVTSSELTITGRVEKLKSDVGRYFALYSGNTLLDRYVIHNTGEFTFTFSSDEIQSSGLYLQIRWGYGGNRVYKLTSLALGGQRGNVVITGVSNGDGDDTYTPNNYYFTQTGNSRIRVFVSSGESNLLGTSESVTVVVRIQRVKLDYGRILSLYGRSNQFLGSITITGSGTFTFSISSDALADGYFDIQIAYGGWKNKAWKLSSVSIQGETGALGGLDITALSGGTT